MASFDADSSSYSRMQAILGSSDAAASEVQSSSSAEMLPSPDAPNEMANVLAACLGMIAKKDIVPK